MGLIQFSRPLSAHGREAHGAIGACGEQELAVFVALVMLQSCIYGLWALVLSLELSFEVLRTDLLSLWLLWRLGEPSVFPVARGREHQQAADSWE